ncbi:acyl-CoA dehydrogenase [Chitinasiproducens palmae]|uniref:3-methylmercaptopropionyl-CoA dehydrogenase n=1 Tax=Chitinasiproducens palmae TaxID=1770053 RepID=A0A1H2PWG7_9BURK|nr:acyl-CoA dehydrogenase [Chitinasiproducens palmae]SDV50890.1 Acyl-CoA dehydrogenase [Chitinasiproducens palmae]
MAYEAPLEDMRFVMNQLAGLPQLATLPGCEEAGPDTVAAILTEGARFASERLAPLNPVGDRQPPTRDADGVHATPGFAAAFRQYADNGWQGVTHPAEYGGQGLPKLLAAALAEMFNGANLAFALCPLLSDGAIEALLIAGNDALKREYVPKLVAGEWTGTMNLTEAQAGSDLSLVRTRAEPVGDGRYRIVGTKIFITYGDHDLADNIVHLVLARLADAPAGIKGLSLFLVPKWLPDAAGKPAQRNDVHCLSLEHKLGIHGSPTAVLQFGEHEGATGFLVGQENRGLETMFIMMNAARFMVGMQGVGIAEHATQQARAYARERLQSRAVIGAADGPAPIIRQPDVRRMLATMRCLTEAGRMVAYQAAAAADRSRHEIEPSLRDAQRARYAFLVPIVKGWCTEMSLEVSSLAVQVHGGSGYIEETGVAQFYRDARILTIYEGTTAIQANDLIGRKILRDGGAVARALFAEIRTTASALGDGDALARAYGDGLTVAVESLDRAVAHVLKAGAANEIVAHAVAVPMLLGFGYVLGGWQYGRALLALAAGPAASDVSEAYAQGKRASARFYLSGVLPRAEGLCRAILACDEADAAASETVWGVPDALV